MNPDEIARRLRDEGMAQAPPDLAPEVMRQVAREPRKRRLAWRRVRPIAAWATAAAAIAAGGFALSQLGGAGSSSSEASSSAASGAAPTRGSVLPSFAPSRRVYTVASRDATRRSSNWPESLRPTGATSRSTAIGSSPRSPHAS